MIVYAVIDDALSPDVPLGDALEVFIRRRTLIVRRGGETTMPLRRRRLAYGQITGPSALLSFAWP